MKKRRYKSRSQAPGWSALEDAWKVIDSLPEQKAKYPQLAHAYHSIRNKAIKRYIWTGEPKAIDDI